MIRAFLRFIFFEIVSILFFLFVHVTNPSFKQYSMAVLFGFVSGLILFIVFTILFPKRKRRKDKLERRNIRKNKINQANTNQRCYQDTDKIYINK